MPKAHCDQHLATIVMLTETHNLILKPCTALDEVTQPLDVLLFRIELCEQGANALFDFQYDVLV